MSLIGGIIGGRGSVKSVTFNDKLGVDGFEFKDSDGFIIAKITSAGDLQLKGRVTRTSTN